MRRQVLSMPHYVSLLHQQIGCALRHAGTKTPYTLRRLHEASTFLRQWIQAPRTVGAIAPSGPVLSATMAKLVPSGPGTVIELGPGTGVVTNALLQQGIAPKDLIAVEYSSQFCKTLRHRFPHITVIEGDAANLSDILKQHRQQQPVKAIVSSLPLVSLSEDVRHAIIAEMKSCIADYGCIIQFTYALWKTSLIEQAGCRRDSRQLTLCNIPPAKVERFYNC